MPATGFPLELERKGQPMAAVMIGVDPHKGSHTAVAISGAEESLGELGVRASEITSLVLIACKLKVGRTGQR
jgi:hypothetical protein